MSSEKVDILLVDDKEENLLSLEALLSSGEYNLVKTRSGDEALRYLLTNQPALILMDVQMPQMDGYETTAIIKGSERTRDIPIIFVTALNMDQRHTQLGYAHGAVDFIYKPFHPQVLRSKVAVFAELSKRTRRLLQSEQQRYENDQKERALRLAQLELKSLRRHQADQKRFRDLVEGIHNSIVWSLQVRNGLFNFVSPSAEPILGYSIDRWYSQPTFLESIGHANDRDILNKALEGVSNTKNTTRIEHRVLTATGKTVWFQTELRWVMSEESFEPEVRGLSVDVTKAKEAEALLLRSRLESDFVAEASRILSTSIENPDRFKNLAQMFVSSGFDCCVIGLVTSDKLLKAEAVAHRDSDQELRILDILNTRIGSFSSRHLDVFGDVIREAHGQPGTYALTEPIILGQSALGGIFLFRSDEEFLDSERTLLTNISDRLANAVEHTRLYRQARDAIAARDDFLSIASHELKTPLTSLKLQLQLVSRGLQNPKRDLSRELLENCFEKALKQVDTLNHLIDELLDVSRIRSESIRPNYSQVRMSDVIRDTIDRLGEQLNLAKCKVSLTLDDDITGMWDRYRLVQVVTNLLSNAIKYAPGKPVEIVSSRNGDQATLLVKDNGPGISPDRRETVFNRFERGDSAHNVAGLGLGLFIVRRIVEAHSGTVHVESTGHPGSTFVIQLPLRPTNAATDLRPLPQEVPACATTGTF